MKQFAQFFGLLILLTHFQDSQSYSHGAPPDRVCSSMIPGHGGSEQTGESPFTITLSSTELKGGESIRVTLSSKNGGEEFKGFFAMGKKSEDGKLKNTDNSVPVGNIKISSSSSVAHHVKCNDIKESAITHTNGEPKKSVTFDWEAPNEDADFVILATFVQSYDKFWVKQPSAVIRVKRNAALGESKPTTTTPKPEKKELSDEAQKLLDEYYEGCGKTKGCFGLPAGCVGRKDCDMFTTFRVEGSRHIFQVSGTIPEANSKMGYVAVGLSFDKSMGQDSVIACFKNDNEVEANAYVTNLQYTGVKQLTTKPDGLEAFISGSIIDNKIICEYERTALYQLEDIPKEFDLANGEFHLLLAYQFSDTMSPDVLVGHAYTQRQPSQELVNLTSVKVVDELPGDYYDGCGITKGCFGMPAKCVRSMNCEVLTTFRVEGNRHIFQVSGKIPESNSKMGYLAVGLSFDGSMGHDSVITCFKNEDTVQAHAYTTIPSYGGVKRLTTEPDGLEELVNGRIFENKILCEYIRTSSYELEDIPQPFNLASDNFHILLSHQFSDTMSPDTLPKHAAALPSQEAINLSTTKIVDETSEDEGFYEGCGITKGCFGLPAKCIRTRNCDMFTTFRVEGNRHIFQVSGRVPITDSKTGYVAVGLSFDQSMGNDSVIACFKNDDQVQAYAYTTKLNYGGVNLLTTEPDGLDEVISGRIVEDKIECEYVRTSSYHIEDIAQPFDLFNNEFHILLAYKFSDTPMSPETLDRHDKALPSQTPVNVSTITIVDETEAGDLLDQFYSGCGETKGCFGVPNGCVRGKTCDMFVTFTENLEFQLSGKLENGATQGHVSMGLSFDHLMGQDSVTGCVLTEEQQVVQVKSYYNLPDAQDNAIMNNPDDGLKLDEWNGQYLDGILFCEFNRTDLLDSPNELKANFKLREDEYYLFLARAANITFNEAGKEQLGMHITTEDLGVSYRSLKLNEMEIIDQNGPITEDEAATLKKKFYDGCGTDKGCFGLPDKCVPDRNCDMFVSFNKDFVFQITGNLPDDATSGHISVGLSFDSNMGEDSVSGCILDAEGARARSYYNIAGKGNRIMPNATAGLESGHNNGKYLDGVLFCEFTRSANVKVDELGKTYDLGNDDFYFLLARAASVTPGGLGYHTSSSDRGASDAAYPLSHIGILGARSNILVELHAGLMIIAWLMCASTGMFTARYYKQTHTGFNPINKAFWFVLHISCMFTAVFLTIAGGIIIFIEVGGYSNGPEGPGSWHPILGLILVGLALIQVLIAFFRPHPGTPKRPLFNWIHWTVGNTAHIVGIACIFLAKELGKAGLEDETAYIPVVTGFVVFHVVMHVVMAIHTMWADKQMDSQVKMRSVRPGPMKPSGKSDEAPGTGFRTAILTLYLVGCAGVAITLIVLVANRL